MTYNETIDYLFSKLPMYQRNGAAAFKKDLKNINKLTEHLGNPHDKFKSIHVAGTNGKGSVSHMIASVLQTVGYKVGLYTSPHLKDFRERIRVNGKMISESDVISFVDNNKFILNSIEPSFFEMSVAMAFDHFANEKVDFAVVEVGMGGRLDSTNVLRPILCVITNIGLDHQQFLGETVEQIAHEKAGIIKRNVPVVIGETTDSTRSIFINKAEEKDAPIYLADYLYSAHYSLKTIENRQVFNINKGGELCYQDFTTDLLGVYQKKNVITALQSIDIMKDTYNITIFDIFKGFENVCLNTGFKGRWQIYGENPSIICDTGHNIDGINEIVNQLKSISYKKLHIIYGTVNDKKLDKILALLPVKAEYYFTKANIPRSMDENELAHIAGNYNLKGETFPTVNEAFNRAKENAGPDDLIFIGGSTFVVAEVV